MFDIEIVHIMREDGQFEYMLDPLQYMINRCDRFSKIKHSQMEKECNEVCLDELRFTIDKAVNTYIREMDSK